MGLREGFGVQSWTPGSGMSHLPDERGVREGRPDVGVFVKLVILCKLCRGTTNRGGAGAKGPTVPLTGC